MVGSEAFEYTVVCDAVLGDADFYSALKFDTFAECVSACSVGDNTLDGPYCQGVSYYETAPALSGGNCHLKASANQTMAKTGVDSAMLIRVSAAVVDPSSNGAGVSAAQVQAANATMDMQQMSSSMASIMSNSSTSMPLTTPRPLLVEGGLLASDPLPITAFSTSISDGSTFSTGFVSSFGTTYANGSWKDGYYSSWTEKWAAATAVYGATANGYVLTNSTNTETSELPGQDGNSYFITTTNTTEFTPTGYDVTQVVSNQTYASNGTEIQSTATTYQYSYQTAGAASGGSSGASSGGSAGGPASSPASTSAGNVTSTYSSQTVIYNSGATGGVFSTGSAGGPSSTSGSVVTNTYGTGGSSGTVISGQISMGGTGGASSMGVAGGPGGTGGSTMNGAAGGPSSTSLTLLTIISTAGNTGGGTGYGASGGPGATGGQTMSMSSGGPSSSTGTFSNSNGLRSGELPSGSSSTSTSTSTVPLATGLSPYVGPSPLTSPSSSTGSFTNSNAPRSGTYSTTSTSSGTGPSGYGGPSHSSSTSIMNTPSGTEPQSSGGPSSSSSGTFTDSKAPRSGTFSTTSSSHASPLSTSPSSGTLISTNATMSSTTATVPPLQPYHYYGPPQVYPAPSSSPTGTFTNSNDNRSPYPGGTGSSTGTVSTSSPPYPYSNSGAPRSPYPGSSGSPTGTGHGPWVWSNGNRYPWYGSSTPAGTGPSTSPTGTFTNSNDNRSPYPGSSSTMSCSSNIIGTTTMFTTVTEYGCYSSCGAWGGNYGGPQAFGPPVWATTSTTASSPTAT